MHRILTERERELLKHFLENSEKGKGFRLLKFRSLRAYPNLAKDMELIKKAINNF